MIFATKKDLAEANAALETATARVAELEASLATANAALAAGLAQRDAETERFALAEANATSLVAAKAGLTAQLAQLQAEFDAYKAAEVQRLNAEAARVVAAAGHAPLAIGGSSEDGPSTMPRADFSKLAPAAQAAFCRKGGRLSDN